MDGFWEEGCRSGDRGNEREDGLKVEDGPPACVSDDNTADERTESWTDRSPRQETTDGSAALGRVIYVTGPDKLVSWSVFQNTPRDPAEDHRTLQDANLGPPTLCR